MGVANRENGEIVLQRRQRNMGEGRGREIVRIVNINVMGERKR